MPPTKARPWRRTLYRLRDKFPIQYFSHMQRSKGWLSQILVMLSHSSDYLNWRRKVDEDDFVASWHLGLRDYVSVITSHSVAFPWLCKTAPWAIGQNAQLMTPLYNQWRRQDFFSGGLGQFPLSFPSPFPFSSPFLPPFPFPLSPFPPSLSSSLPFPSLP